MGTQYGPNAGISGTTVNLPGVGAKFQGRFYGYKQGLELGEKPRLGRGSDNWQATRTLFASGTIAITGKVRPDGFPIPTPWQGQAGTITVQFDEGKTEEVPIIVTAAQFSRSEESEDLVNVALTARVTADPTWSGWPDDQPTTDDPSRSDQEQYVGTSKAVDPQGLGSGASRRTDVWGNLADTDAAELNRLATIIAAAQPPFAGMKLRSAVFQRDSLDGGEVLETWGLTDTAEDVVNPRTAETIDPQKLGSSAMAAAINATPSTPTGDALFVKRTETTTELNDGHILHTATYGRRDTKEDVEFPNTVTGDDPYDLADRAQITRVHDGATPPADPVAPIGELVERATTQLDRGKWQTVWTYANLNSEQRIEFPAASIETDPSALEDTDAQSDVTNSSTVPATPASRFTDGKLRKVRSTRVGGTPEKWLHVWEFGRRTTADDVTMPKTVTDDEVSDIDDSATLAYITTSSAPPAVPAAPVGQHLRTQSTQIHGSDGGKWLHVFEYGNTTALQKIQFPTDVQDGDPSLLQDEDHQSDTTGTSTAPAAPATRIAGLVLRETSSVRIAGTPEKWLHRWTFARRTTAQDVTFPGTVTADEVSDIADDATVTLINSSSTPPATPSAPLGQLLEVRSEQLTAAGKWKHTFHFGNTTALQHIQFPTDVQESDPSLLEDEDHQSDVTGTSTPPSAPATRIAGLVLRSTSSVRIAGTPEKWLHRWSFGRRSTAEDVTFPGTVTTDEVSDVADEATITRINTSSTPPTTPTAPVGQLLETRSEQLTDSGKWKHTFRYGNTTALQRIQFPTDVEDSDPSALEDEDHQSATSNSSTPPSTPATRIAGLVLRSTSSVRLAGTPELWLHRWTFGRRSTEEDVTFPGTVTTNEVSDIADDATVTLVNTSSTPPATPSAPVGQLLEVRSEQLTDAGKWKHTFRFGNTTALQRIQFPTDVVETDPSALQDEDRQSATNGSSTPPVTPATRVSGLVLRTISSRRISGTPEQWLHEWTFGRRSTSEDVTFPGTVTQDETSNLRDKATITQVTGSSTPPATPAAPLGQILTIESEQLTDAGKWRHTFTYGNTTAGQEAAFAATDYADDTQDLTDTDRQTQLGGATAPADPTSRISGLKLRYRSAKRIGGTPEQWLYTWEFGRRDTKDDVEMPATVTGDDPFDLSDTATITQVTTSGTAPPPPSAPVGQHVETETIQLHATAWRHTFKYANLNSEQRLGFPEATLQTDPSGLSDFDRQYQITGSSTPPSAPATRIAGLVLRKTSSRREGGTPEKWLHVWEFGRTSTAEDVTFPGSVKQDDVGDLQDRATVTVINTSATAPASPTAPVGQLTETRSEQLTDAGKWKHTFTFENTTSVQRAQFPNDKPDDDPQNLEDSDVQASVTTSVTPPTTPTPRPSALKLRSVSSQRIGGTPAQYLHVWRFGRRNTQEDVELPATISDVDQYAIDGTATIRRVNTSSTPPATPAAPLGECVSIETVQIHAGSDAEKWQHTFKYAQINSQQRHTFPENVPQADPSALRDTETQAVVDTSASPPSDPSPAISGLVLRVRRTRQVSGTPAYYLHVWEFGRRSTEQDVTLPGTVTTDEVSNIADEATVTIVNSSGTPPASPAAPVGQLLEVRSEQLTSAGKWQHTFRYGNTTALQKLQFPTDTVQTDPALLEDEDEQSDTSASSTPPATPATRVSGLVLRSIHSQRIAGTPELWLHRWRFGRRTTAEDITLPGTVTGDDVSDLRDSATITQITGSPTPPTAPAAPVGQLVETRSEQLTDAGKWKHTFRYANNTPAQDVTFPDSPVEADPALLSDEERIASITTSSTAPATPTPTISGLQFRRRVSKRLAGTPTKWEHVFIFARRTTEDDVEFDGSSTTQDNTVLSSRAEVTLVGSTDTPPSVPSPPTTGVKHVRTVTKQLTPDLYSFRFEFAPRSSQDDVEFDGTVTQDDPSDLIDEARITQVTTSGTPPSVPAAPAGTKHRRTDTQQLTDGKWKHTFVYGRRNSEDDVEMEATATTDDQSDIADSAEIAVVHTSSTSPTAPTAPVGTKLVEVRVTQIHDSRWKHLFRYARKNRKDEIEMDDSSLTDDPQGLEDAQQITQVTTTSTPPAAPGGPSGTVLVSIVSRQVHDTKWRHTWRYATRSTKDEVEMPGTFAAGDPQAIRGNGLQTIVFLTGSAQPGPIVPAGLQTVSTKTRKLNQSYSTVEYTFDVNNHQQELEFPETRGSIDPENLESRQSIGAYNGTPSTPAGFVRRSLRSVRVTPLGTLYVGEFGLRSTKDDVEFPGTGTNLDPTGLDTRGTQATVYPTATPPLDPTPPTGTQIVDVKDEQLTAGAAGLSVRRYQFAPSTKQDEVELRATSATVTPTESYARSTGTVLTVASSDTAAALADTAFAANVSDPLFDGVEVRKLTPQRALQIIKRANDDKMLRCTGSHSYEDAILGRPKLWGDPASYGSPDCVVHVTRLPGQPIAGLGGYTNGWVQPIKIWRHRAVYHYRRRLVTTDPNAAIRAGLIGVTNNAALLGFNAHFLMFGPPILHYSFAIAGAHLLLIDYVLNWDSQMWMNDLNLADGRLYTNSGVLLASPGYFDPVVAFSSLMTMAWPPDGNLAVITT